MIRLDDATVNFALSEQTDHYAALSSVNCAVGPGEWLAIVGANGSGKTTFLRAIAGLLPLASGSLQFAGEGKPNIAMVLQEPDNQFVTSSVLNELTISVSENVASNERNQRVNVAVDIFALDEFVERNPHRLSGGEKQRLALATVWLQEPDVVLLDEPTAFLDPEMTSRCIDFVSEMHRNGAVVLWATPGGEDLTLAERVVFLERGCVTFDGPRESFFDWAREEGAAFELPAIRALTEDVAKEIGVKLEPVADIEALASGLAVAGIHAVKAADSSVDRHRAAAIIENVSFAFGNRLVLKSINLSLGGCAGVTGPNASGKTTLLLLAAGALEPSTGHIIRTEDSESRVLYLPQSPERMFFAETVAEELAFGPKQNGADPSAVERASIEALRSVGFDEAMLVRSPLELSVGEMRRIAFAVALVLEPRFVLFDEPTAGLDSAGRRVFLEIVVRLREDGAAVVIASHDTAMLCEACDTITFLDDHAIEEQVDIVNGEISSEWPTTTPPLIFTLQEALESRHGVDVRPRAATPSRFAERIIVSRNN